MVVRLEIYLTIQLHTLLGMKIYFDVCCINRPFDDQTHDRIHMESEAIITIFKHIEFDEWILVSSGVINYEINQTTDEERLIRLQALVQDASVFVKVDQYTLLRASQIQKTGIKAYDSLHIACAEQGKADVLLSTDDKLIKLAKRNRQKFHVEIENPLIWLQKVVYK
jgi:predicted nucleic acid-binding protein